MFVWQYGSFLLIDRDVLLPIISFVINQDYGIIKVTHKVICIVLLNKLEIKCSNIR